MTEDERYMGRAIRLAKKARDMGDVPIGCIIVYEGKVIGKGFNRRNAKRSALAHAEIIAIKQATRYIGDWRLEDCTMYVTLEPCQMCSGAILQSRIPRVVMGCMNPKAGCAGSVINLLQMEGFNHKVDITSGVREKECSILLSEFFSNLRRENKLLKKEKDI